MREVVLDYLDKLVKANVVLTHAKGGYSVFSLNPNLDSISNKTLRKVVAEYLPK